MTNNQSVRFSSVQFDNATTAAYQTIQEAFYTIEKMIEANIENSASKNIAFNKLEEAYMWVGSALKKAHLGKVEATPVATAA